MIVTVPMKAGPPIAVDLANVDLNNLAAAIDWKSLIQQFLPLLIDSLFAKDVYAATKGFDGPVMAFKNAYQRCCEGMAETPK